MKLALALGLSTHVGARTAPLAGSSAIPAAGTTLVVTFNLAVSGFSSGAEGFTLTGLSGGATTLDYASGNGTTSITFTLSRTVSAGETGGLLAYTAGDITSTASGLPLVNFSGQAVANNSTQP